MPVISVIILNYNGEKWLHRCLDSLKAQTIFHQIEVIIADNASRDGSDRLAEDLMRGWKNGLFLQNGANLGYAEGNNRGAEMAHGRYLFFLNNDTWLEPDCLEKLLAGVEKADASAGHPVILDYANDHFQSMGASGLDFFGIPNQAENYKETHEVLTVCGCAFLIQAHLFRRLGGFDPEFFLYAEETDLSWRIWLSGHQIVGVPAARLHHRGATDVNPKGGTKVIESRTSYTKRFYATRNGLLFLLKNAQHILLLLIVSHLLLLAGEALVGLLLVRDWSYIRHVYLAAFKDCWRLRNHIREERCRIAAFRTQNDFQMLRFMRLRPSRWADIQQVLKRGVPIVDRR